VPEINDCGPVGQALNDFELEGAPCGCRGRCAVCDYRPRPHLRVESKNKSPTLPNRSVGHPENQNRYSAVTYPGWYHPIVSSRQQEKSERACHPPCAGQCGAKWGISEGPTGQPTPDTHGYNYHLQLFPPHHPSPKAPNAIPPGCTPGSKCSNAK